MSPAVREQLDDAGLCLFDGLAGQLVVGGLGPGMVGRLPAGLAPGDRPQAAVALDDGAHGQRQLAPPRDVGGVAERADHRHPRALLGVGQGMGDERDGRPEQRRDDRLAEHRPVALVVWVGDDRHAGGEELRPRRVDQERAVGAAEHELVVRPGDLAVVELGLGHRRAHVDVPQRRRLAAIREVARHEAQEPSLRRAGGLGADRGVGVVPVDRQPDGGPELVVLRLELRHDLLAQLDEVRPADRDGAGLRVDLLGAAEVGIVGKGGVDDRPGDELDAALHVEAVVVPPHRVEDLLAAHALVASREVGVRVGHHVPDVQRSAHRRRGRVDGEHVGADLRAVEPVGAVSVPALPPLGLETLQRGLLRDRRHGAQGSGALHRARSRYRR